MEPEYGKVFANIYEAVGNLTIAQEVTEHGYSNIGSMRIRRALASLKEIAKDFPAEYEAAILAHPSRRQT